MADLPTDIHQNPDTPVSIQAQFNEATRPGFDPDAAEAAMRRLNDTHDMQEQQVFQRQLSGAAEDSGEMAQAVGAARSAIEGSETDKERKRRRELTDAALRAAERIAEIDRQLAGLYDERERILEDMRETQERIETLRDGIRQIAENGDLERDEKGALENRALEAQIRAYERRTGRPVDRNDPETLLLALNEQLEHEGGEMNHHRDRERENRSEIDRLEGEREAEIETIRREHPDADVDELVAALVERDDAASFQVAMNDGASSEIRAAAVQNRSSEFLAGDDEDIDLFGAADEELEDYEAFADEVDPAGTAQPEPESEPEAQHGVVPREGYDHVNNGSNGPSGMGG